MKAGVLGYWQTHTVDVETEQRVPLGPVHQGL